jgi:hypothetical protein
VVAASGTLASLRTGEDVVVVDVIGDPSSLVAALGPLGTALEVAASRVTVALPGDPTAIDTTYDAIRDAAVATGTPLRRLQRRIATLEEVFLAASAGSADPAAPTADGATDRDAPVRVPAPPGARR